MIGGLIFLGGLVLLIAGIRRAREIAKYEFENRTSGGVVQFESFEDSNRHGRRRALTQVMITSGFLLTAIGGVILLFRMIMSG